MCCLGSNALLPLKQRRITQATKEQWRDDMQNQHTVGGVLENKVLYTDWGKYKSSLPFQAIARSLRWLLSSRHQSQGRGLGYIVYISATVVM